jgi:deoxycytidine triphosphate deaminase
VRSNQIEFAGLGSASDLGYVICHEGPRIMAGILTREDIIAEVRQGRLIKHAIPGGVQACSYDLRIGTIFFENKILKTSPAEEPVILGPGGIISLFTLEELFLPKDIAATAFAMNAMSSQGVLVLNPGHVDPGFQGPLTVRILNVRATPKVLLFGTPIFTVVFYRLDKPTLRGYDRNKTREDREFEFKGTDIEQNPKTLLRLLNAGDEKPLMTPEEVDRRIMTHWLTLTTVITAGLAAVFGLIAAVFALIPLLKTEKTADSRPPPELNETSSVSSSAQPTATPFWFLDLSSPIQTATPH